ncbi:hypothetical protein [Thiolapillus sp.]|nr:hypothetical protein [Thiolapillus sp.]
MSTSFEAALDDALMAATQAPVSLPGGNAPEDELDTVMQSLWRQFSYYHPQGKVVPSPPLPAELFGWL